MTSSSQVALQAMMSTMQAQLKMAKGNEEVIVLGAISREEAGWTYDDFLNEMLEVKQAFNKAIDEIRSMAVELKEHKCVYGDDDYCIFCGRDGRA